MYTMMAFAALTAGLTSGNAPAEPTWLSDYGQARKLVKASNKPMAVFVGKGEEGWKSVVKDGLDAGVRKLLAEQFVCVYVNTATDTGKTLADQFEVDGPGLILSDRTGTAQAFSLSGTLTRKELTAELETVSDPDRQVTRTKTVVRNTPARTVSRTTTSRTTTPSRSTSYYPQYRLPAYRSGST